jgi:hypothetical protein
MLVILAESEIYFASRPFAEEWLVMDNPHKTKFLTMASNKIENLPFIGEREDNEQTTLFPRLIKTPSQAIFFAELQSYLPGNYIVIEETPDQVKWAVYEEAFAIFKYMNEERYKLREQGVQSASRGGLSEAYETYRPVEELMSVMAKSYLRDWLVQSAKI